MFLSPRPCGTNSSVHIWAGSWLLNQMVPQLGLRTDVIFFSHFLCTFEIFKDSPTRYPLR